MGDRETVQAGEYRVSWKSITSARIDTTALKKALPDVAKHAAALAVLEEKAAKLKQRKSEAKAHQRNIRTGKKK